MISRDKLLEWLTAVILFAIGISLFLYFFFSLSWYTVSNEPASFGYILLMLVVFLPLFYFSGQFSKGSLIDVK